MLLLTPGQEHNNTHMNTCVIKQTFLHYRWLIKRTWSACRSAEMYQLLSYATYYSLWVDVDAEYTTNCHGLRCFASNRYIWHASGTCCAIGRYMNRCPSCRDVRSACLMCLWPYVHLTYDSGNCKTLQDSASMLLDGPSTNIEDNTHQQ